MHFGAYPEKRFLPPYVKKESAVDLSLKVLRQRSAMDADHKKELEAAWKQADRLAEELALLGHKKRFSEKDPFVLSLRQLLKNEGILLITYVGEEVTEKLEDEADIVEWLPPDEETADRVEDALEPEIHWKGRLLHRAKLSCRQGAGEPENDTQENAAPENDAAKTDIAENGFMENDAAKTDTAENVFMEDDAAKTDIAENVFMEDDAAKTDIAENSFMENDAAGSDVPEMAGPVMDTPEGNETEEEGLPVKDLPEEEPPAESLSEEEAPAESLPEEELQEENPSEESSSEGSPSGESSSEGSPLEESFSEVSSSEKSSSEETQGEGFLSGILSKIRVWFIGEA